MKLIEVLEQGIRAHSEQRYIDAEKFYLAVLNVIPENPDANHNLGVLKVDTGRIQQSLMYFYKAVETEPDTHVYWHSLIKTLLRLEKIKDAKKALVDSYEAYSKAGKLAEYAEIKFEISTLDSQKKSLQSILLNLEALFTSSSYDHVIDEAKALLSDYKDSAEIHNLLASSYAAKGDFLKSAMEFKKACSLKPNFVEAFNNYAAMLRSKGDYEQSLKMYDAALKVKPDFVEALVNQGIVYNQIGEYMRAIANFEKALSIDKTFMSGYQNLGIAHAFLNDFDRSYENLKKAISLEPSRKDAYVSLCEICDKYNKLEELEENLIAARNSLCSLPDEIKIYMMLFLLRKNKLSEAVAHQKDIDPRGLHHQLKIKFFEISGKLADKLKQFDEAVEYFSLMNNAVKKMPSYKNYITNNYMNDIKIKLNKLNSSSVKRFMPKDFRPGEIGFIIGFPRSGTTLLDSILSSHSEISVVEESTVLEQTQKLLKNYGEFDFINSYPEEHILESAREYYWSELSNHVSNLQNTKIIIDKLPLNILHLNVISHLFPKSKIIFCVRHPSDVVLSNWMQNFQMNAAMANTLDIQQTAEFYDLTMKWYESCQEKLHFECHRIFYEALIQDKYTQLLELSNFLGVKFEDEMLNSSEFAKRKGRINTPSYSQVVQPLYRTSIGKWQNYSDVLSPAKPYLQHWIEKFGYSTS